MKSFLGGSPDSLAASLSQGNKVPVMIETSKKMVLQALTFDPTSVDTLNATFRKPPLILQPGSDFVLSDQAYVRSNFGSLFTTSDAPVSAPIPVTALANGKVTYDTSDKTPVLVGSISNLKWTKPFRVNYLLGNLALSMTVKDLPEAQFLDMLRKAVGGQFVDTPVGRVLEPDESQLRMRLTQTFSGVALASTDALVGARQNLFLTAAESLTDSQLDTLFAGPNGSVNGPLTPGSSLSSAALSYIQLRADRESTNSHGQTHVIADALRAVDNRRAVQIRVSANGMVHLTIPVVNSRGKRSTVSVQ